MVEQLTRYQLVEYAVCAVAVDQPGALQRLVSGRPRPLLDERDDHPRRRQQRTAGSPAARRTAADQRPAGDERPDEQHRQRQVTRLEMQCDSSRGQ